MQHKKIIIISAIILFLSGVQTASAIPTTFLLGNYAVVGMNATSTANANLTASGTIAFVTLASAGAPCLTVGTTGLIATSTCGGTNYWTLSGTSLYPTSTAYKVGIGTTTPSQMLSVVGTSTFTGNVGIGTTAPEANLHIMDGVDGVRSIKFSDTWAAGIDTQFVDTIGERMDFVEYINSETATPRMSILGGNVGIGTTSPNYKLSVWGSGTINPFNVASSTGTSLLMVNTSGNVGIGTTVPVAKLDVRGQSDTNIFSLTNTNSLSTLVVDNGYLQTQFYTGVSQVYPSITFTGDTNTGFYHPAADTVGISIAGAEKVRIDNTGNVGIGTTTPAYKLDVVGTGRFTGALTLDTALTDANIASAATWSGKQNNLSFPLTHASTTHTAFATSTDTNLGIVFDCAVAGTCTVTPVWIGTLADGRIASAATWNAKQSLITFPIPVASTSLAVGSGLTLAGNNMWFSGSLVAGPGINLASSSGTWTINSASTTLSINLMNATTTDGKIASFKKQVAFTISKVSCNSINGTSTLNLLERTEATPNSGGTAVLTTSLVCGVVGTASSTDFANAGIAANAPVVASTTAVAGTDVSTFVYVDYNY